MTKRIFRSICFAAIAVFLSSIILIIGVLYNYFTSIQKKQLRMQTSLAAQGITNEGIRYFDGLDTANYRITWIDTDGRVLYDNQQDTAGLENHLQREEIRQAILTGYGESERYSTTLMKRSLYTAQRLENGTILRLSIAQNTILTLILGMAPPIFIVLLAAIVLSVIMAMRLSRKIVKPLNRLNLDHPLDNDNYDELLPLLRRIDSQQKQLKIHALELDKKQDELDTIIRNIKEGMILLNPKGKIISMNPAAMVLLDTNRHCIGEDILMVSRNLVLQEVLSRALRGEQSIKTTKLGDRHFQIDASPVISNEVISGIALLLFDITEKEQAEQMRREFTANVSHELKTPLHSISGHAELLKNGIVKDADICSFAEKIYLEAQRMIQLVEDIINLSHLDEGASDMRYEAVDLYTIARTTVQSLEEKAAKAGITLVLSGQSAIMEGIPHLLQGIVFNLCDNAIKYNHKNGSVSVNIEKKEAFVFLSVSDTGIGIPPEHQEHIFERFYRVDKSHSKEAGGTGLGLSIVKHAAKIHHAEIELHSVMKKGTTIIVRFPVRK